MARSHASTRIEIETSFGVAWADIETVPRARAALFIGHGAGGSVDAPDIVAVRDAVLAAGCSVVRITQPYRVAGKKATPATDRLDEAWLTVTDALRKRPAFRAGPIVHSGRSSGARVACRCAGPAGAAGVVALAFPTHPPGRPDKSRVPELEVVPVPLLVVQGDRDAFGQPPAELFDGARRRLVSVPGADHGLKKGHPLIAAAVVEFVDAIAAG
jgi:predicted alpha/beta-hydrolase family hydrolase